MDTRPRSRRPRRASPRDDPEEAPVPGGGAAPSGGGACRTPDDPLGQPDLSDGPPESDSDRKRRILDRYLADVSGVRSRAFGQRVRALRTTRSWTLARLAERSGVAVSTLSLLERGRTESVSFPAAYGIARAFGFADPAALLSGEVGAAPVWHTPGDALLDERGRDTWLEGARVPEPAGGGAPTVEQLEAAWRAQGPELGALGAVPQSAPFPAPFPVYDDQTLVRALRAGLPGQRLPRFYDYPPVDRLALFAGRRGFGYLAGRTWEHWVVRPGDRLWVSTAVRLEEGAPILFYDARRAGLPEAHPLFIRAVRILRWRRGRLPLGEALGAVVLVEPRAEFPVLRRLPGDPPEPGGVRRPSPESPPRPG